MAQFHIFDVSVAEEYGVNAAILFHYISLWIEKNRANGKNIRDGKCWTYNSTAAFKKIFPYMGEKSIRNALKRLEDEGVIVTSNYNQEKYDRTTWYTLTEKGEDLCQKGNIDVAKRANGCSQKGEPIPNKYHINNIDISNDISMSPASSATSVSADAVEETFNILWDAYPRKRGKAAVTKISKRRLHEAGRDKVMSAIENYKREIECDHREERYIMNGSTFFNGRWADYLAAAADGTKEIPDGYLLDKNGELFKRPIGRPLTPEECARLGRGY